MCIDWGDEEERDSGKFMAVMNKKPGHRRQVSEWSADVTGENSAAQVFKKTNKEITKRKENGFMVTSDPIILYKLGKFVAKSKIGLEDGVAAISDFITIQSYQLGEGSEAYERRHAKALYYLGMIFSAQGKQENATEIFKDIVSTLGEFGMTEKSEAVQNFFKSCEN